MSKTSTKDPEKVGHKKRLRDLELEEKQLEVKRAKAALEQDKIRVRDAKRGARWKDTDDHYYGRFDLIGNVGGATVDLEERIRRWARVNPGKPITLRIFSGGGSVFHGIELYNTLRRLSSQDHHITTVCSSYAASMGSHLFLAGDTRIVGPDAQVMFHPMSAGTSGSLHEMIDEVEWMKRLNAQLDKTTFARTKITPKLLKQKASRSSGWWLDADECIKYAVAHEVV